MEEDYRDAFWEVDKILEEMPDEMLNRIPEKFIKTIRENKSKTYNKIIDNLWDINNLKKETIVLLGFIYRDFLCDKEEKNRLIEEEKQILKRSYNYENIFKKDNTNVKQVSNQLIKIEDSTWYSKILKLLKSFFQKK